MKKKTIIFTLLIVLILALGIGFWIWNQNHESDESDFTTLLSAKPETPPALPPLPADERSKLAFSKKMIEDFTDRLVSYPLGQMIPNLEVTNHAGEKFRLHKYLGKKMLLYFDVEACESCFAYYAILKDWARRYQDQLQIVMFFNYEVREGFVDELVDAGIQLVPFAEEAIKEFGVNYTTNYLVDSEGFVKHYFDFEYLDWIKLDQTVDLFVRTEQFPEGTLVRNYLQKGQKIPEVDFGFAALEQKELTSSDLYGKPSLIFMSDQTCIFCEASYPLINQLHEEYQDRANVIFLLSDWRNNARYEDVAKFYEKYDQDLPRLYDKDFADEDQLGNYVTKKGITAPVYPALEVVKDRWGIAQIPGVLILDAEGVVQNYLLFENQRMGQEVLAETYLREKLEGLLK